MQRDFDHLREFGWTDADIFDAVLVTSLYACAKRFSAGLGLTPDFDLRSTLPRRLKQVEEHSLKTLKTQLGAKRRAPTPGSA